MPRAITNAAVVVATMLAALAVAAAPAAAQQVPNLSEETLPSLSKLCYQAYASVPAGTAGDPDPQCKYEQREWTQYQVGASDEYGASSIILAIYFPTPPVFAEESYAAWRMASVLLPDASDLRPSASALLAKEAD